MGQSLLSNSLVSRQSLLAGSDTVPAFARNLAAPILHKDATAPYSYCDPYAAVIPEQISEPEMSATFIISTMRMDREGDVVVPKGCLPTLDNYRRNPVVFFDHQKEPLPIGRAANRDDSKFGIEVLDDMVLGKCWFSDKTQVARDVWGLVCDRVLRAVSIGFTPVMAEKLGGKSLGRDGNPLNVLPRYLFTQWDLFEFSVCGVGINPEALRIQMSAGRIKSDVVRKSLSPLAQVGKEWANGAELDSGRVAKKQSDSTGTGENIMPAAKKTKSTKPVKKAKAQPSKTETPKTKLPANIAAVEFSKSKFTKAQAIAWLSRHGLDASLLEEKKTILQFVQSEGEPGLKKSVSPGIVAVIAKAVEEDDKEDEKTDETKADEGDDTEEKSEVEDETKEKPEEEPEEESDEEKADDSEEDEEKANNEPLSEKDDGVILPGAQCLADGCYHAMSMMQYAKDMLAHNENPAVIEWLNNKIESAQAEIALCQQLAKEHYPNVDFKAIVESLQGDDSEDSEETKMGDGGADDDAVTMSEDGEDDDEDKPDRVVKTTKSVLADAKKTTDELKATLDAFRNLSILPESSVN